MISDVANNGRHTDALLLPLRGVYAVDFAENLAAPDAVCLQRLPS